MVNWGGATGKKSPYRNLKKLEKNKGAKKALAEESPWGRTATDKTLEKSGCLTFLIAAALSLQLERAVFFDKLLWD